MKKKIYLMIPLLIIVFVVILSVMLLTSRNEFYRNINARIETALSSKRGSGLPDQKLMSHRMILSDVSDGLITPADAAKAYANTAGYFDAVKRACITSSSQRTRDFLACANNLLGEHFYYYPARETAPAWAGHYSDCDSNVYLLLDALGFINRTASIVYAPGHAFLSWTDEQTGEHDWWETTSNRNHGKPADLSKDNLYRKTMASFYYQPQSAGFAESFYKSAVTFNSLSAEKKKERLTQISQRYPDNPFVEDLKYEQITSLTPSDVAIIQDRLKTDISSGTKKYLLANYYMKTGDKTQAAIYISKIDIDSCDPKCRQLREKVSFADRLWLTASGLLSQSSLKNQYGVFITDKLTFPVSEIQDWVLISIHFISIILVFFGLLYLYNLIKQASTRQK